MTRFRAKFGAVAAAGLAAALILAGCGTSADEPPADDPSSSSPVEEEITLRFAWWGNDTRNKITEDVIAKFEASHPNIKVEGEPTDWSNYFTKLSTQVASGDSPDIIQMDEKYLAEYADKGALLDLESINLDTSKFAPGTIDPGRFDGKLYAATFAVNAPINIANPSVFEQANVALPDDKTWTWDQFADIATQISAAGAGA
ncbi:MAG: extracellular solute-binding protein, partial [Propionibacteriaceae bacterium]|nr:extracellular solute-binding protein [Propionibacteriaceae bacterium]